MKKKTKKIALLSLCAAMMLSGGVAVAKGVSNVSTTVIAEETLPGVAAKIGETSYDTFADALAAVSTMTGDVTVELYDKVTLNSSFNGNYDSITFVGKTANAEIYLDVQGYITATGKDVSFKDLTLSKVAGGYITNAGFMNLAFGVFDVSSVTYTNCIFANGAYASSGTVTFNGCTFYRSHDRYGLWAYGDVKTIVDGCTFADIRGIKMYAEGGEKTVELTVKNTDFSTADNKPAIVLTYGKSVTLEGNTYSSKGVFELDLDGDANGTLINSTDEITCVNDNGACGVIVDGKIYQTVQDAMAVATEGSTITLLHNSTETVSLPEGVKLNKNGYTAENVQVHANTPAFNPVAKIGYAYYDTLVSALKALKAGDTLTLTSDLTITENWDNRNTGAKITVPVTIDGNGHTLKFTGTINDGYNYLSIFRFEAPATVKDLTVDMSEAISGWGSRLRAISAKSDITVDSCTFIGNSNYSTTNAIIFGEGAGTASLNVSVADCTFTNWTNGVSDEQGGKDTASTLTIANNTFNSANVNVSAAESVSFTGNTMSNGWLTVTSYTNNEGYTVKATGNTLTENAGAKTNSIKANPNNIVTDDASLKPVAKLGEKTYFTTMDSLLNYLTDGDTITLTADVQLFETLYLPADVTFNGNGYAVNGAVVAYGDVTFVGYNKISSFGAFYTNLTFNIGVGATLEITGSGRMTIGHGATFNITGSISDAKTADVASLTPSLIIPGASFTGAGVTFNATNAYIKTVSSYCSSSSSASGTFDFNIVNCIWEQFGKLAFEAQSNANGTTVNFELKDSVLTTTSHLVFSVKKGEIVIDNSNVNVGANRQLENRSTMIVKNGSVVHGANATSSNANMRGTLIVDNATYVATGEYSGVDQTGMLVLKNGATVTLGSISHTNVYKDATSTLTYSKISTAASVFDLVAYNVSLTADKTALKATESVNVSVAIDKAYYAAEYTFTYDTSKFVCSMDNDGDGVIFVGNLYQGEASVLATYTLTAKDDIQSVYEGEAFSVSANVIQYKEQILNGIENVVVGDTETVKVSLNYTASVKTDFVQGYSLVLVNGDHEGYAYNGVKMFYVEAYGAYAILVEGTVTAEGIDVALSKATGCETIRQSYNVNGEYVADGIVDIKDATAVYACSIIDFDVVEYMELYLRADVNGDCKVNMVDINAVVRNYTR